MLNFYKRIEEGAALLLALFVSAIVSIIGYGLFSLTMDTSNFEKKYLSEQQAFLTVLSLESFSIDYLMPKHQRENITLATNRYDPFSPINVPLERGNAKAQIDDLSDCFNLNFLVETSPKESSKIINQDYLKFFKNLFFSFSLSEEKISEISSSIIDWIDHDNYPDYYDGGEDFYYLSLKNPFISSNQHIQDVTELRKVKGITEEIYKKISPYLCALPTSHNKININALSPLKPNLLMALTDNKFSEIEAVQFLENRPLSGYESVDNFFLDNLINLSITSKYVKELLNVESKYFNLKTEIIFDEYTFIMNSRLWEKDEKMIVQSRKIGNYL